MYRGHIKLWRKFYEWEWFDKSNMVHLFIFLLIKANWKDGKWRGIDIKRGQHLTSYGKLSSATGISLQSIRTCLDNLEESQEITRKSTHKHTIVTLLNYETYNKLENETNTVDNTELTNEQHSTNTELTTKKKLKNDKNDKNKEKDKKEIPTSDEVRSIFLNYVKTLIKEDEIDYDKTNAQLRLFNRY